jgi:hypothetical protein
MAIIGILFLLIPVAVARPSSGGETGVPLAFSGHAGLKPTSFHTLALIVNLLATVLAIVTIFLYRNRPRQITLTWTSAVLWIVCGIIITCCELVTALADTVKTSATPYFVILFLISLLSSFFAARYIRKDIELLKSVDRIR